MQDAINSFLRIFSVTTIRYFVIAGVPFVLFYILFKNSFTKAKIQAKHAGFKDFVREILHSMQTTLVFAVIALIVLFSPLREYTMVYTKLSDYPAWVMPVCLLLSLILHDTYFYWTHRLIHHKRLFKHVHLLHHKSTNPSPWASYSFHFLEAWSEGFVLILLVFILPMHTLTIVLFTVVGFVINVYGHLGYEIAPKGLRRSFLFEILSTSTYHNMHHSRFKGNYGLYFRLWDRLMKTENPDYVQQYDRIQAQRFGKVEVVN
ncbi:sterol desaturase family protein [Mucilaginibacter sp. JRF]|uniref:sterol desaturase family protein n=1 Tax=Mucilaginibacter sp. JRF TaxID=2780088 RepID=UPI0018819C4A|nr:sterol desaturase family protein [Mucilaginibacter sp. JRF]MBE9585818.1 sterol desaturase family protein [Mucilaginibacter sp. JRF]